MTDILIGIITYKRPLMLERALRAIALFEIDPGINVRVLVADNDSARREGIEVVRKLATSGYRFPIDSILVEQQGSTYGRNALLEAAFSNSAVDFIAMMDDDQRPEPQWLKALYRVQQETCADVVGAAVWPEFEAKPPRWAMESKVYTRNTSTTGSVDILSGSGGILISKNFTSLLPRPWFDHNFAMTGGSDADVFVRVQDAGGTFARAADAVIHEFYPTSRVTLRWALRRAFRIGMSDMYISRKRGPLGHVLAKESVKIVGAFIIAPLLLLVFIGSPGKRVDALCKIARAIGKITALFGLRYDEYATIHGS